MQMQVAGDVALYNTSLQFEGGKFSSVNLGVGAGAALGQESGSNEVSGVLSITGASLSALIFFKKSGQ